MWFAVMSLVAASVLIAFMVVRPVACKIGLLDCPGGRKTHAFDTPLIGGVVIYLGLIVGFFVMPTSEIEQGMVILGGLMLLVGLFDDLYDLKPTARLIICTSVFVSYFVAFPAHLITNLDFYVVNLELGVLALPVTVFLCLGLVNAFNMIDGIDGLAGMLFMLALGTLALIMYIAGVPERFVLFNIVILIGVAIFLVKNLSQHKRHKVLLGDAGCLMLGSLTAVGILHVVQMPRVVDTGITNVGAFVWLIAIPLADMLAVVISRVKDGVSPFRGDRRHIHYVLVDGGLTPNRALVTILAMALCLQMIGLAIQVLNPQLHLFAYTLLATAFVWWRMPVLNGVKVLAST